VDVERHGEAHAETEAVRERSITRWCAYGGLLIAVVAAYQYGGGWLALTVFSAMFSMEGFAMLREP
jgi:hypothetical protein